MKTYLLERIEKADTHTLGRFWFEGEVVYTLELPWKNNQKNISCIPDGIYNVVKEYSPTFDKQLWELKGVPNRSEVKFHAANFVRELQGCIAPGLSNQDIDGDGIIDIKNSRKALSLMRELLPEKFKVEIIWNILIK